MLMKIIKFNYVTILHYKYLSVDGRILYLRRIAIALVIMLLSKDATSHSFITYYAGW